jgi:hypothetical protein
LSLKDVGISVGGCMVDDLILVVRGVLDFVEC